METRDTLAPWAFLAFLAVGLLIFLVHWRVRLWWLKRRAIEVSVLAERWGFHQFPDNEWPRGLHVDGARLPNPEHLYNIYEGEIGGVRVMFYDYERYFGRNLQARTVFALKAHSDGIDVNSLTLKNYGYWHGDWLLFHAPLGQFKFGQRLSTEEMEAMLRSTHTCKA